MKLTKALVGEKLFTHLMKSTFYGHFVAGEDRYKIVPTLERLQFINEIFFLLKINQNQTTIFWETYFIYI